MGGQIIFGAMEMTRATWTMEMCKKNKTIKDKKKIKKNNPIEWRNEGENKTQKKVKSLKMTTKCSIHCCKCNELNFLFPHCKTLCMFPCIPPVNGCSRPGASCHVMWWMTNYDLTIHFNQEKWIKDKYTNKRCVSSYFGRWLTAIFLVSFRSILMLFLFP